MSFLQDHRTLPVQPTPEPSQTGLARSWRYVSGAPLSGYVKTDATFFRPATAVLTPTGHSSRWSKLPGWKRAAWRLATPPAAVASPVAYFTHPLLTTAAVSLAGACVCALGGRKVYRWASARRHRRDVVQPLLRSLAAPLGLPLNATAAKWLMVPRRPSRPGQITRIWLPDTWLGEDVQKLMVTRLVTRWLDVPVEAVRWHLSSAPRFVEYTPTPQPPNAVKWKPSADPYSMHIGKDASGQDMHLETLTDNPHAAFVGGSGSGKTTALTLPLLHARQHGALVTVIDLKRMSYTERDESHPNGIAGDPDRKSGVVSGIRIATTLESAVKALAEFLASATAVALMQQRGEDTSHIPPRVLLIDEFGSFAGGAKAWWKGPGKQKGPYVIPFWMHVCLMQGRALDHRLAVGAHQLALDLFGGSDARDLFSGRLLIGSASAEKWITTFGRMRKPAWDDKVKGRGAYGALGAAPSIVQTAYVPQSEANATLRALPEAPDWFDAGESAPWLTEEYVREIEDSYSAGRWVPGWEHLWEAEEETEEDAPQRPSVPPSQVPRQPEHAPVQGECPPEGGTVPGDRHLRAVPEEAEQASGVGLGEAVVGGIVYVSLESLRAARKRDPEFPEPCGKRGQELLYSPDDLREWERNRPRAESTTA